LTILARHLHRPDSVEDFLLASLRRPHRLTEHRHRAAAEHLLQRQLLRTQVQRCAAVCCAADAAGCGGDAKGPELRHVRRLVSDAGSSVVGLVAYVTEAIVR
jgi:hypothetical protein